ncbi:MAG: cytochrome c4, partial [Paraperlucidibaca sp.]
AVVSLLLSVSSFSHAAVIMPKGDANAGQGKAAVCAACHSADGNSAAPNFPKLAGQHAKYIYKQLENFKSGVRVNALMMPMAMALSDQDMADLAVYYSQQKGTVGGAKKELVERGQKIYRGGNKEIGLTACSGCHGPAGKGNPFAAFPQLSGQHAEYTANQLKMFRSAGRDDLTGDKRNNDAKPGDLGPMQMIAAKLSDKDIEALASYIQGLH